MQCLAVRRMPTSGNGPSFGVAPGVFVHDVLVIGGGIAGLVAARRLEQLSHAVAVLEARPRLGGRALSQVVGGHPLDLGPTWVWDSESAIHALLAELGVQTFAHFDDGEDVYESSDGLQRGRFPRSWVKERRVVGGMGCIVEALAKQVGDIRLEQVVHSVDAHAETLRVTTDSGVHTARYVLGALPPSLAAPLLQTPSAQRALWSKCPVWMGDIAKVVAVFERRFWADHGRSGRGASQRGPMVEIHDMSGSDGTPAALFGFVPKATASPDLEERVRAQFIRMFGARAVPKEVVIERWWQPFTATEQPSVNPGLLGHPALREPALGGRFHLISCETSGESPGHINGAVERALAVVDGLDL
jgi:monoamine oxidase